MGDSGMATELAATVGAPAGDGVNAQVTANGSGVGNGVKSKLRLSALWESHSVMDAWLVAAAGQVLMITPLISAGSWLFWKELPEGQHSLE